MIWFNFKSLPPSQFNNGIHTWGKIFLHRYIIIKMLERVQKVWQNIFYEFENRKKEILKSNIEPTLLI